MLGKVKWFRDDLGHGFLQVAGEDRDVFVHHRAIDMPGHRVLVEGQAVEFAVREGPKGPEATDVRIVG